MQHPSLILLHFRLGVAIMSRLEIFCRCISCDPRIAFKSKTKRRKHEKKVVRLQQARLGLASFDTYSINE